MKNIYSFILIGIFLFGLTSAIIGNFLGLGVPHFAELNRPITINDKIDAEDYIGGQTIYYKGSAKNNLEKNISGFYTIQVSNDQGNAMCEDFEFVSMSNGIDSGIWTHLPGETLLEPTCVELEQNELLFQQPVSYQPLGNKTHYAELKLKLNVEPAIYEIIGSVRNLEYTN